MSSLLSSFSKSRDDKLSHGLDAVYSGSVMTHLLDSMLNVDTQKNDLAPFLDYLNSEESTASQHISGIQYDYDVTLNVYASDTTEAVTKVNPSDVLTD
jgi:hypothetical protein